MHTINEHVESFLGMLQSAVDTGRTARATLKWYFYQLGHLKRVFGHRDPTSLIPDELGECPYTYHFAAAVRRFFKWAADAGHIPKNRFVSFEGPLKGQRERVLTESEYRLLMRHSGPALRKILWFLRHTMARPGELRSLRWKEIDLAKSVIRLKRFKCRDRRRDGVRTRVIPLTRIAARLLKWWKTRNPLPDAFVFRNSRRRAWTGNALRIAMNRSAERAGLNSDGDERVVCYTLRHTGATEATRNGVTDRRLAEILGHASTRTTARYQHLAEEDLVTAMEVATKRKKKS